MKNKQEMLTDDDLKEMIFAKKKDIQYQIKDDVVTLIHPQDHWIQRFLRRLSFKIPENSYIELDEYGSYVFQQIDGHKSVYEIGQRLGEHYTEANDFLYNRLLLYLNHLQENEKVIELIDN